MAAIRINHDGMNRAVAHLSRQTPTNLTQPNPIQNVPADNLNHDGISKCNPTDQHNVAPLIKSVTEHHQICH